MQIYDGTGKFFNTGGNWFLVAFAQDQDSGALLAVNHWSDEVKVIRTFTDSSGNRTLKISNVTTTDSKEV